MTRTFAALLVLAGMMGGVPAHGQSLPDKPEPYVGQIIHVGEPMAENWPPDLVITEGKEDRRDVWIVKPLNSCAWCGRPMTLRQAALDRKSSSLWILAAALDVADIELAHRAPCFVEHRCIEGNPLYGQTRAQAYGVAAGLDLFLLLGQMDVRHGSVRNHVGGFRHWWLLPAERYVQSAVGIASTLASWNRGVGTKSIGPIPHSPAMVGSGQ